MLWGYILMKHLSVMGIYIDAAFFSLENQCLNFWNDGGDRGDLWQIAGDIFKSGLAEAYISNSCQWSRFWNIFQYSAQIYIGQLENQQLTKSRCLKNLYQNHPWALKSLSLCGFISTAGCMAFHHLILVLAINMVPLSEHNQWGISTISVQRCKYKYK